MIYSQILKPILFISLVLVLLGCKPHKYVIVNLTEMKAQLSAIGQKTGETPLGEMFIMWKTGLHSVSLGFKPKNTKDFISKLTLAANEEGFNLQSNGYVLTHDEVLLLCSSKVKHQYISATLFKDNSISVGIYENGVEPPFGRGLCY